jgi:hypothetical protein
MEVTPVCSFHGEIGHGGCAVGFEWVKEIEVELLTQTGN